MTWLLASLAGSLGAVLRYLVSGWAQERSRRDFPLGTLVVNVVGSFALGVIAGSSVVDSHAGTALVGLLGGFTTFSTWTVETARLGSTRAVVNLTLMLGAGIAAAAGGLILVG